MGPVSDLTPISSTRLNLHVNLLTEQDAVRRSVNGLPNFRTQTHRQFLAAPFELWPPSTHDSCLIVELPWGKVLHELGVKDYSDKLAPFVRQASQEGRPTILFTAFREQTRLTHKEQQCYGMWQRLIRQWKRDTKLTYSFHCSCQYLTFRSEDVDRRCRRYQAISNYFIKDTVCGSPINTTFWHPWPGMRQAKTFFRHFFLSVLSEEHC